MERSTIKYAIISFTLIAFILFLVSGISTTHYIKQNTTLNSVKGFTTYSNAGYYDNLVLINASTQATGSYPLSLPSQYNIVIGFFVEGYTNT